MYTQYSCDGCSNFLRKGEETHFKIKYQFNIIIYQAHASFHKTTHEGYIKIMKILRSRCNR